MRWLKNHDTYLAAKRHMHSLVSVLDKKVGQWLRFSYEVKVLTLNLQLFSRQKTILQFPFPGWQWMHWGERRAGVSNTDAGPATMRSGKYAGNTDKRTNTRKVSCGLWYSYYLWRCRSVDLTRVYCRPVQPLICLQSWRKSGRAEHWELVERIFWPTLHTTWQCLEGRMNQCFK